MPIKLEDIFVDKRCTMKLHVNKHTFSMCEVVKGNTGKKKPKYRVGWENRNKNKKVVNSKESLSTQKIAVFGDK